MLLNRRQFLSASALLSLNACTHFSQGHATKVKTLKAAYADAFKVGCVVTQQQLQTQDTRALNLLNSEFNALTMENAMKWEHLHPSPSEYHWQTAEQFLDLCSQQNHAAVGHVLVWHSQTPKWVYTTESGQPLNRTALLKRMEDHVQVTTDYCKGRIWAWDVVNEAVENDGTMRNSFWRQQIGDDYISKAFALAHEADPNALLLYNDYNMHAPEKRKSVVELIRQFKKSGTPIHGIGMQGHIDLSRPNLDEFEKSIIAFANEGVEVHISELDIDVLSNPYLDADISTRFDYSPEKDPYRDGLPDEIATRQAERAESLFTMLLKHQKHIARVSFWGLTDGDSWKNGFPIPGRVNHPLLFDRNYKEKQIIKRLKNLNAG